MRGQSRSVVLLFAALVVAAVLAVSAAAAADRVSAVSTLDFTTAQRTHTLRMLSALPLSASQPAAAVSSNTDFCAWADVACHRMEDGGVGAEVTIRQDRRIELPADVEANEVRITALKVRAGPLSSNSELVSSLGVVQSSTLTTLDLSNSHITSELPAAWGNFVVLEYLRLGNNNFYGTLPPAWSGMAKLKELALQNNNVSGTLPAAWSTMVNMVTMTLDNNSISGTLPSSWASMTGLTKLSVGGTDMCGGVLSSWPTGAQHSSSGSSGFLGSCAESSSDASASGTAPPTSTTSTTAAPTSTTSTTAAPTSTTSTTAAPTTTQEPPSVTTNCTVSNCLLCPVTVPELCSACSPGYTLTITRSCVLLGGDGTSWLTAQWQLMALGAMLVAITMGVY